MRTIITLQDGIPESGMLVINEGDMTRLFFDFSPYIPVNPEYINPSLYNCNNVDVIGSADYGSITSAIIVDRYPSDKKDAILANYELVRDGEAPIAKSEEYKINYDEYQAYRVYAKSIANKTLEYVGSTGFDSSQA